MSNKYLDSILHRGPTKEEKKLINIFNFIRDGYDVYFPRNAEDFDNYCLPKHTALKKELEKVGYDITYGACMFRWSDQTFLPSIKKTIIDDLDCHFFLNIRINEQWQNIDCTFKKDFIKYNKWDAKKSTSIAVRKHDGFLPHSRILEEIDKCENMNKKEKYERNKVFYRKANKFFETLRNRVPKLAKMAIQKGYEVFE